MKRLTFLLLAALASVSCSWAHVVAMSWRPPATLGNGVTIEGYNVYRSSTPGGEVGTQPINGGAPVTGTFFTDSSVAAGQTYYYVITTVSSAGESVFSGEGKAVIPTPQDQAALCWQYTGQVTSSTADPQDDGLAAGGGTYTITVPDGTWISQSGGATIVPISIAVSITIGIPPAQESVVPMTVTGCSPAFTSERGCSITADFAFGHGPGTVVQVSGCS